MITDTPATPKYLLIFNSIRTEANKEYSGMISGGGNWSLVI